MTWVDEAFEWWEKQGKWLVPKEGNPYVKGKKPPATPNELSPRRIKDTRNGFAKD